MRCTLDVLFGRHVPDNIDTAERQLRPSAAAPTFESVILVEGIGVADLEAAKSSVVSFAAGLSSNALDVGVFRLAYLLDQP
jgi:hypothetical protein